MTRNPYCRVDPSLPDVADADVHCTHCGQSLETILEGGPALPPRHFIRPTVAGRKAAPHIRTTASADGHPNLCPIDRDGLTNLIYRAQRDAALCNEPAATDRSVA